MENPAPLQTLPYSRANFTTHLPVEYRYSPLHFWAMKEQDGLWRIGFTKFATRMLGEMVDHGFEVAPGTAVSPGTVIGWIEGFKALTELFCIATGEFAGGNVLLKEEIAVISRDPYGQGWIYKVKGELEALCTSAEGYRDLLDATIDQILVAQQRQHCQ